VLEPPDPETTLVDFSNFWTFCKGKQAAAVHGGVEQHKVLCSALLKYTLITTQQSNAGAEEDF
jgi:hypothetical protein